MIAAVILAAGLSRRMGKPKMTLPWGNTTVIGRVIEVFAGAGVEEIVVVTGGAHQEMVAILRDTPVRLVYNPRYAQEEMTISLQVGLSSLSLAVEAAFVALGDQPQMQAEVIQVILSAYETSQARLVIPSYQMRRGHPWLIVRSLWPEIMALKSPETLRDFLNAHAGQIHYVPVDTPSILQDLDTPADYERHRP